MPSDSATSSGPTSRSCPTRPGRRVSHTSARRSTGSSATAVAAAGWSALPADRGRTQVPHHAAGLQGGDGAARHEVPPGLVPVRRGDRGDGRDVRDVLGRRPTTLTELQAQLCTFTELYTVELGVCGAGGNLWWRARSVRLPCSAVCCCSSSVRMGATAGATGPGLLLVSLTADIELRNSGSRAVGGFECRFVSPHARDRDGRSSR